MKLLPQMLGSGEGAAEENRVLAVRFPHWLPLPLGMLPARAAQDVRTAVESALEQVARAAGLRALWPFSHVDEHPDDRFTSEEPADPHYVHIETTPQR